LIHIIIYRALKKFFRPTVLEKINKELIIPFERLDIIRIRWKISAFYVLHFFVVYHFFCVHFYAVFYILHATCQVAPSTSKLLEIEKSAISPLSHHGNHLVTYRVAVYREEFHRSELELNN